MKINYYEGNIKNTKKAQIIDVAEFLNKVKYETFKPQSDRIASEPDKNKRQKLKSQILPYVTISGVFSERSNSGLLEHSGLIAVDVDGIEDELESIKNTLSDDPHSFAVFKSVSGTGLCVLIRITTNPESHLSHFRWIEQYYYDQFNIVIDSSCKDVSRPRYVSADSDIRINENSKRAGRKTPKKAKPKQINWIATENQMDRIVTEIVSRGINIAESYDDYLTVAFALADGYGEAGRNYFHAVTSISDKYNEKQADAKYSNALRTRTQIKIGSFFYLCKQAGIELRTESESKAFAVARAAKKNHSDVQSAVETAEAMGITPEIARDVASKVFERDDISLNDNDIPIIEELAAFIRMNSDLKRNSVTRLIQDVSESRELDNILLNTLYIKAKTYLGNRVTKADIESIIYSDNTPTFNPFEEFIKKNEHKPHKPEIIDQFIQTLNLKDERSRAFVLRWLYAIPAVIEGDTVRIVLTLIGGQETGKTEWFRRLLPADLKPYFGESNLMRDKDDEIAMGSNLIILDDEMGGKSKKDSQKFKELTSKEFFMLREPYGRNIIKLKRLALLAATTNDPHVIYDNTGNTRILPVELSGQYNFDAYNAIDKDQLFIELIRARRNGKSWKLDADEKELLQELTIDFETVNAERELILKYFSTPTSNDGVFMSTTEIKNEIEQSCGHRFFGLTKLGVELRKLFPRKAKKIEGRVVYGYYVNKNTSPAYNLSEGSSNPTGMHVSDDLPF